MSSSDPDFLALVEHYGADAGDDALYQLILKLYNYSRSYPWPQEWLNGLKQPFALPADADFESTPWAAIIRAAIVLELEAARPAIEALRQGVSGMAMPAAYIKLIAEDTDLCEAIVTAAHHSWQSLTTVLGASEFARMPVIPKKDPVPDEIKEFVKNERNIIKDAVKKIKEDYCARTAVDMLAELRSLAPLVATLAELVIEFDQLFSAAKKTKGIVDFNDLEHFCLAVLMEPGVAAADLRPSTEALALQEKFIEVMVDEYQDTNGVQETILRLVAGDNRFNRFMVGDVKQSIYRFRLAEPELFLDKYRAYAADNTVGLRVDLAKNFRSRPGILYAANFLFCQLMTASGQEPGDDLFAKLTTGVAELEYGAAERLNPGPDYPDAELTTLAGPVELLLIDLDQVPEDGSQTEDFSQDEGMIEQCRCQYR